MVFPHFTIIATITFYDRVTNTNQPSWASKCQFYLFFINKSTREHYKKKLAVSYQLNTLI